MKTRGRKSLSITIATLLGAVVLAPLGAATDATAVTGTVVKAGLGSLHGAALFSTGALFSWGNHMYAGTGSSENAAKPVLVATSVADVAVGSMHTIFLKTDGTVWGYGWGGPLGKGEDAHANYPIQLATSVKKIAAGNYTSFILKTNGVLYATGDNTAGALGIGKAAGKFFTGWKKVGSGFTDIIATAELAGDGETVFAMKGTTLYAWGLNSYGQIGDGTKVNRTKPVLVMKGVKKVSKGSYGSTAALLTNGDVYTWGGAFYGVGQGDDKNHPTPALVLSGVKDVEVDYGLIQYLKTDGSLWVSGKISLDAETRYYSPTQIDTLVASIVGCEDFRFYFKVDGSVYVSGDSLFGQTGSGSKKELTSFTKLSRKASTAFCSKGDDSASFLKVDKGLYAAGHNWVTGLGKYEPTNTRTFKKMTFVKNAIYDPPVATLSALKPSVGKLSPSFAPGKHKYTLTIPANKSSVKITAATLDPSGRIEIDLFYTYQSSKAKKNSITIKLDKGDSQTVNFIVSNADGYIHKYDVKVVRQK
ncbi:MAG: cadherin-like beta sandwich domain-containing protein [Propionibacteriaceae bacterium]|nr:cadherin-like beta sandwich domain-containing protein [Propionibacteriaceae bacterium]